MACRSSVRDGQQEPEQHRADHRSEDRRRAAEDEGAEREERLRGGVEVGVDRLGLQCVEHAAEPADHAAEDQRLHLVDEDVLAECACGVLVLADGLEDTAPRTVRQEEHEPAQHQDESPSDDHRPEVVTVELHAEEVVLLTESNGLSVVNGSAKPNRPLVDPVIESEAVDRKISRRISDAAIVTMAR